MPDAPPLWSIQHPLWAAAAVAGYSPETVRQLRHKLPALAELGMPSGRDVYFNMGETALLAILAELSRRNRTVEENLPAALGLMPVAVRIAKGEIGTDGRDVYAIEATLLVGRVQHYVDDPKELTAAVDMFVREGCVSLFILNLSNVLRGVILGWMIASFGEEKARKVLRDMLAHYPLEAQPTLAKEFKEITERLAAHGKPAAKATRITDGTLAGEGTSAPATVAKPKVRA